MTGRRRSVLDRTGRDPSKPADCFECAYCEVTYDDWPADCPDCGRVVVRVVEPRPVPDL